MKNIRKVICGKSGMTLFEVIIGMVLTSVILTVVSSLLTPISKTIIKANNMAELNNLVDNISLEITNDLAQAVPQKVEAVANGLYIGKSNQDIEYTVNLEGMLERNGGLVMPKRYYKGKTVEVDYKDAETGGNISSSTKAFIVTVAVYDSSGAGKTLEIKRDYAVKPIALNQY